MLLARVQTQAITSAAAPLSLLLATTCRRWACKQPKQVATSVSLKHEQPQLSLSWLVLFICDITNIHSCTEVLNSTHLSFKGKHNQGVVDLYTSLQQLVQVVNSLRVISGTLFGDPTVSSWPEPPELWQFSVTKSAFNLDCGRKLKRGNPRRYMDNI